MKAGKKGKKSALSKKNSRQGRATKASEPFSFGTYRKINLQKVPYYVYARP